MDPHEAAVARASQAHAPCPARDRPFNASAARLRRLKHVYRFPLPGRMEA